MGTYCDGKLRGKFHEFIKMNIVYCQVYRTVCVLWRLFLSPFFFTRLVKEDEVKEKDIHEEDVLLNDIQLLTGSYG